MTPSHRLRLLCALGLLASMALAAPERIKFPTDHAAPGTFPDKWIHGWPSARDDPNRLYRARLLHFTGKGAQAACAELHKKKIACTVVRPSGLKVASQ